VIARKRRPKREKEGRYSNQQAEELLYKRKRSGIRKRDKTAIFLLSIDAHAGCRCTIEEGGDTYGSGI